MTRPGDLAGKAEGLAVVSIVVVGGQGGGIKGPIGQNGQYKEHV